jgi:glucans biosynthesis protein C
VLNPVSSIGIYQMPASLTHIATPLTWADYPNLLGIGPMWFAAMLLVFDFGYLAWRLVTRNRVENNSTSSSVPGFIPIAAFVLLLAIASYLIRIPLPLGKYVISFPSLAYLPQYLSFFVLGTIAARGNWFRAISDSMGKWGFWAAFASTIILFPIAISPQFGVPGGFLGGGGWQSAVYALWDSVLSVGMCLALVTFFRRFFDQQSKVGTFLSQQSFTVYIFHAPILVFLALLLRGVKAENLLKFALLAVIAIPLCFGVAYLIRKIPSVSRIL